MGTLPSPRSLQMSTAVSTSDGSHLIQHTQGSRVDLAFWFVLVSGAKIHAGLKGLS